MRAIIRERVERLGVVRRLAGIGLVVGASFAIAACGSDDSSDNGEASSGAGKKVAIVIPDPSGAYAQMACGARIEGEKMGFDVAEAQAPGQAFDVAGQARVLQSALTKSPSGLIYTPADAKAGAAGVQTAVADGIPVVNVDARLGDPSLYVSFVGTDGVAGARSGGELLAQQIGESGTVAAVGILPDNPITVARINGFEEAIESFPNIELLPVLYPELDANKITAAVTALLTRNPEIKGIYATNGDLVAPAVAAALRSQDKAGQVKLVTWDLQEPTIKLLQDGTATGSVVQKPREWGRIAIQELAKELDGEEATKDQTVPTVTVTNDTIDDPEVRQLYYTAEC